MSATALIKKKLLRLIPRTPACATLTLACTHSTTEYRHTGKRHKKC